MEEGVQQEFVRLEKYRTALVQMEKYIADGVVRPEQVVLKNDDGTPYLDKDGKVVLQGNFLLNICPDESKAENLKNTVSYSLPMADGEKKKTAQDMCVMFLLLEEMDENFQYESLLYLNAVIADSLTVQA